MRRALGATVASSPHPAAGAIAITDGVMGGSGLGCSRGRRNAMPKPASQTPPLERSTRTFAGLMSLWMSPREIGNAGIRACHCESRSNATCFRIRSWRTHRSEQNRHCSPNRISGRPNRAPWPWLASVYFWGLHECVVVNRRRQLTRYLGKTASKIDQPHCGGSGALCWAQEFDNSCAAVCYSNWAYLTIQRLMCRYLGKS
jgi:hypothetical protein